MAAFAKVILAVSVIGSLGLIYNVHLQQELDRARLHEGVIRDQERQRYKQMLREMTNPRDDSKSK